MRFPVKKIRRLIKEALHPTYGGYKFEWYRGYDRGRPIPISELKDNRVLEFFDKYLELVGLELDDVEITLFDEESERQRVHEAGTRYTFKLCLKHSKVLAEVSPSDGHPWWVGVKNNIRGVALDEFLSAQSLEDLGDLGAEIFSYAMMSFVDNT